MDSCGGFLCPVCATEIDPIANRWVQESCGHRICRACFLTSEEGCIQCKGIDDNPRNPNTFSSRISNVGQEPALFQKESSSPGLSVDTNVSVPRIQPRGLSALGKLGRRRRKNSGNWYSICHEESWKSLGKAHQRARKSLFQAFLLRKGDAESVDAEDNAIIEGEDPLDELGTKEGVAFKNNYDSNDGNILLGSWERTQTNDVTGVSYHNLSTSSQLTTTTSEDENHDAGLSAAISTSSANRGLTFFLERSRNDSESRLRSCSFSDSSSDFGIEVDRLATDTNVEIATESYLETLRSALNLSSNSKNAGITAGKRKKRNSQVIPSHVNVIRSQDARQIYECNVCKKKFKTRAHIKYHQFCQNGEKPFKCEQCGQGFISKSHYQYHLRIHTGERPYACPTCGKRFNQRGKVTRHMKSHTGEKPFICHQCGREFTSGHGLRSHSLVHSGERPYECEFCDKSFTGMTNLKKHLVTHTGERPFACPHCDKAFGMKWTLAIHLRTHSNERPYACTECMRAFSNSKDLQRHSLIHSGERPYKCCICRAAFRRKDNLSRHIRNTHDQPKQVARKLVDQAAADYITKKAITVIENCINKPNILQGPMQLLDSKTCSPHATGESGQESDDASTQDGITILPDTDSSLVTQNTPPAFLAPLVLEIPVSQASNVRRVLDSSGTQTCASHLLLPSPLIPLQKVIQIANFDNGMTELTIKEEPFKTEVEEVPAENEILQQDPFFNQTEPECTYYFMNSPDGEATSLTEKSKDSDAPSPPPMRVNAGTMTEFKCSPEAETTHELGVQVDDCLSSQLSSVQPGETKLFPKRNDIVSHVAGTSQTDLSTMMEQSQNGLSSNCSGSKEYSYFLNDTKVELKPSLAVPKIVSYCSTSQSHGPQETSLEEQESGSFSGIDTQVAATENTGVTSAVSSMAVQSDLGFTRTGYLDEDSERRSKCPSYHRSAGLFDIDLDFILPNSNP